MYLRRKVYSVADNGYGEDFYPVENTYLDEQYYSVPMTEEEYYLFSDFCDALYSDHGDAGGALGATAGALGAAGAAGAALYNKDKIKRAIKNHIGKKTRGNLKAAELAKAEALDALRNSSNNNAEVLKAQFNNLKDSEKTYRNVKGELKTHDFESWNKKRISDAEAEIKAAYNKAKLKAPGKLGNAVKWAKKNPVLASTLAAGSLGAAGLAATGTGYAAGKLIGSRDK